MLAWLSPIWTIGGFDSCVHMAEEAANAAKAVPYGIMMPTGEIEVPTHPVCYVPIPWLSELDWF